MSEQDDSTDGPGKAISTQLGRQLRELRLMRDMSTQQVQKASGGEFKASVLGAYERGERSISVPRLVRLCAFYDVPASTLFPGPEPAEMIRLEVHVSARREYRAGVTDALRAVLPGVSHSVGGDGTAIVRVA